MLQVLRTLPKSLITVAYSGGVDSSAVFHFLRLRGANIQLAHLVHGDSSTSSSELQFCEEQAKLYGVNLVVKSQQEFNTSASKEESWRSARLAFFRTFDTVVTGHTLDDAVEWYLYSSLNGEGKIMPYQTRNVFKPFLHQRKEYLVEFMEENNLPWIEDPTNHDPNFAKRNYVRNILLPHALEVNPGMYTMVRRKILSNVEKQNASDPK